ncbi:TIGR03936 family radical SAM-associated protein [Sporomusa sp.]|uniref:TIGR03936 family radical SAM-associated protein n=1 Tax=Sporomusa sp. TaxID=2078658 RepID=UPI002B567E24|nr:TIGR03936 family radical SAM-associated protein [Sporomusa sp.]HWR05667.1 TIGR03936 family radical SAM-associated protein [Sporomusa sp.]
MAKLRLKITKGNEIRYVSHLDFAGTIERVVRRARLPAAYSEGFNPHMKMAFASALAVGVTSDAEYLDLELTEELEIASIETRMRAQLPAGIELKSARYMHTPGPALMAVVNLATYDIIIPLAPAATLDTVMASINNFNSEIEIVYIKETPKGRREIDIKEYLAAPVTAVLASDNQALLSISLSIKITPTGSVKPAEVLAVLTGSYGLPADYGNALINRTGLFVSDGRGKRSPIEL